MNRSCGRLRRLLVDLDTDRLTDAPCEIFAGGIGDGLSLRALAGRPAADLAAVPHADEENLLILVRGAVVTNDGRRLGAGGFVYLPDGASPELRDVSADAIALYFAWRGRREISGSQLPTTVVPLDPFAAEKPRGRLIHGSTRWLSRLHAHLSRVAPGAGYAAHRDRYAVMLVVLAGDIETMDGRLGPGGLAFAAAGEAHGLRSVGAGPATYLAFEFRAPRGPFPSLSRRWQAIRPAAMVCRLQRP